MKAAALRVLCLWNARWLKGSYVQRGWRVGTLSARGMARVTALRRWLQEGGIAPAWMPRETAPPVVHPLDPRLLYQEEEASLMEAVGAEGGLEEGSWPAGCREGLGYGAGAGALPMAAEERAEYGRKREGKEDA